MASLGRVSSAVAMRSSGGSGSWKKCLCLATISTTTTTTRAAAAAAAARPTKFTTAAFSSTAARRDDLVLTHLDTSTGIATLTMNHPPVNSLSLEMLQALSASIQQAQAERKIQGLILQSSNPSIFSAGLDILELHQPNVDRLVQFWTAFQDLYLNLYGSRLACIAAMQGHAPAAGCMLALSCDYRILASAEKDAKPPTIGLNETKLGIAAPSWLAEQMIDTIGRRKAELALSLGELYTPEQALSIGLVDKVVPKDQVIAEATKTMQTWLQIPPQARVASKMLVRKAKLDHMKATRQEDLDYFVKFVTNEKVQANLSAYLQMLAKKKQK